MGRFSRLSPEEIAAGVLLVVVIALAVIRPGSIPQLFESPYATPAPGGGPALQLLSPPPSD